MNDDIKVSILCNAYNHEKYIRKAMEGFVMQKTDFVFEILVHDDASTDRTADIIREFEKKYPELVKPVYQTENQHSQKVSIGENFQWPRVKGKYIAVCEGDDYWTDPLKLQKQYDAMEKHPDIDICAHAAIMVNADTGEKIADIAPKRTDTIISAEEVIIGEGGYVYVSTNSLFYRADINQKIPDFRKKLKLDYTLQIHGSLRGGMLYLSDCMSVYNFGVAGSWTLRMRQDAGKRYEHYQIKQEMLEILDQETGQQYHEAIEKRKLKNEFTILLSMDKYKEALGKRFREFYMECSIIERVKIRIKAAFPGLVKIKRRKQGIQ